MKRVTDREDWLKRAQIALSFLQSLGPGDFYDDDADRYHPVRSELGLLIYSIVIDIDEFRLFLDKYPQRKSWIPLEPSSVDAMKLTEVVMRVQSNVSDERWVSGCLDEPFRSGALAASFLRIVGDFNQLSLVTDDE